MLKVVVLGDMQVPYHDTDTLEVVNQWLEDFKPDRVVFNGDILDATGLGKYPVSPDRTGKFKDDVEGCREILERYDYLLKDLNPTVQVYFNEGNHEDRIRRYLWTNASELAEVSSIQHLLGLDDLNWQYTPYYNPMEQVGRIGTDLNGLLVIHGWQFKKWSGASALAAWQQFGGSGVMGHTHRLGAFYHRNYHEVNAWFEGGCLCSLNPHYTILPDWQQGMVAGYIFPEEDDTAVSRFDLRCIPIVKHKFVWEGRLYK